MKKIAFLLLVSFLLFSCEKPEDLTKDPKAPEIVMPVAFTLAVTNVSVYDGANGKITVSVSSGIPPLQYKIGSNDYQAADYFDNLKAGSYTVTVKDSKNTTSSKTATITQPKAPIPALLFIIVPTNVEVYGFKTGSISVSVSSGVPPYTYTMGNIINSTGSFTELYAGEYNITVTDNKQQTLTKSVIITQPSQPIISQPSQPSQPSQTDNRLVYSGVTVSSGSELSQCLNTFAGRNNFSVAFRYTTTSDEVNFNSNKPGPSGFSNGKLIQATLFAITNYPADPSPTTGSLELNLISTGGEPSYTPSIYCKRFSYVFGQGSYSESNIGRVNYDDSNIWKGAYVVLTYDGTNMKLYLNGVLKGAAASSVSINASKIYFGTSGKPGWIYDDYNGTFSNVKIYNEALTASDVAGLN